MRSRSLIVPFAFLAALAGGALGAAKPAPKSPATAAVKPVKPAPKIDLEATDFQSVQPTNPSDEAKTLPYVLDVPRGWEMRTWSSGGFVMIGPKGQMPPTGGAARQNPWVIALHLNPKKFPGAEQAIADLKANLAKTTGFTLISAEVRDFGGTPGMLALTDSGADELSTRTYTVRVPLGDTTLDVIASAPRGEFAEFQPLYERILFSLQPAAAE